MSVHAPRPCSERPPAMMSGRMEIQEPSTSRAAETKPPLVFINHRGSDLKDGFVSHLYEALTRAKLRPFLDARDIGVGKDVTRAIAEAIAGGSVHVAIFSTGYAESEFCLTELCCMLLSGKPIVPVFFDVAPKDLIDVEAGPFKGGFDKHIRRKPQTQVLQWRMALSVMNNSMGLRYRKNNGRNEAELVTKILETIRQQMSSAEPDSINKFDEIYMELKKLKPNLPTSATVVMEELEPLAIVVDVEVAPIVTPMVVSPEVSTLEVIPEAAVPMLDLEVASSEVVSAEVAATEVEPPMEPNVLRSNPADRRLNVLLLGDTSSVDIVVTFFCGANSEHTTVKDHARFRESRNCSRLLPVSLLYRDNSGGNDNRDDLTDVKNFVKARSDKWHWSQVEAPWVKEVSGRDPKTRFASFPDSTSRLHAVWFASSNLRDLPNRLVWPGLMKNLCNLAVQILVTESESTSPNDLDSEYEKILKRGLFPNAQNLKELIVKVALNDGNLKETLWRSCWALKTGLEVGNAAKVIREIRKELGSSGRAVNSTVGNGGITKEGTLRRSAEFILKFLCSYWDVRQAEMLVLLDMITPELASGTAINIGPYQFVRFSLVVAAVILHDTRDHPERLYNWGLYNWDGRASDASSNCLQAGAVECYHLFFPDFVAHTDDDQLDYEEIRDFLQDIFVRNLARIRSRNMTPRPVLRDTVSSKVRKFICRGITA